MRSFRLRAAAAAFALLAGASAHAGPFILAGTDADDHGFANAMGNQDGWFFMQRAIENLAASSDLTTPNRVVVSLGSSVGTALTAAQSAFTLSGLPAAGWTFMSVPDLTIAGALTNALLTAGIIMLDSGNNVGGGLTAAEQTVLTNNAAALDTFVGDGGGLFSQSNSYGFLTALVPGLTAVSFSSTGLTLTAAGNASFPGLTNQDLSAGPYHNFFTNVGPIPVLATGLNGQTILNVIIGSSGGSITNPDPPVPGIPEPETYAMMAVGLAALGFVARRRKASRKA